jgi:integral membrane protein
MKTKNTTLNFFRRVAFAEGVSFLVLLLIAMPLKYLAGLPQLVTVVGWAHGVLFVAFLALAVEVKGILNKNFPWLIKAFAASVLPAGTFLLERNMQKAGDFNRAPEVQ